MAPAPCGCEAGTGRDLSWFLRDVTVTLTAEAIPRRGSHEAPEEQSAGCGRLWVRMELCLIKGSFVSLSDDRYLEN